MSTADARDGLLRERGRVAAQIAGLAREFDGLVEASESVAADDEHDPEGHTIAFERQQLAALLRDAQAHLADLDAALARVDAGAFGRCEQCGLPISPERLDALPATRRCVVCASADGGPRRIRRVDNPAS